MHCSHLSDEKTEANLGEWSLAAQCYQHREEKTSALLSSMFSLMCFFYKIQDFYPYFIVEQIESFVS